MCLIKAAQTGRCYCAESRRSSQDEKKGGSCASMRKILIGSVCLCRVTGINFRSECVECVGQCVKYLTPALLNREDAKGSYGYTSNLCVWKGTACECILLFSLMCFYTQCNTQDSITVSDSVPLIFQVACFIHSFIF